MPARPTNCKMLANQKPVPVRFLKLDLHSELELTVDDWGITEVSDADSLKCFT